MKSLFFALLLLATACTTNRQILRAVNGLRADFAKIDSVTKTNQIFLNYEKSRIDSIYRGISDDDLRRRLQYLARPKN